jgi:hypothetical protein
VEEPPPQVLQLPKAKGLLKSKEKEAQRLAAAAADAAAAAALQTVVRIRELDGTNVRVTCQQVSLGGDVAVGVHGGPLLGISYKRLTASGAELSGEDTSPVMQLWSWDGRTKVRAGPQTGGRLWRSPHPVLRWPVPAGCLPETGLSACHLISF